MSISLLFLELWQFSFTRDWPEVQKTEIPPVKFYSISGDWGELGIPNLAWMSLIKCYWKLQSAKVTAFTISESLRGKQQGGGGKITPFPSSHTHTHTHTHTPTHTHTHTRALTCTHAQIKLIKQGKLIKINQLNDCFKEGGFGQRKGLIQNTLKLETEGTTTQLALVFVPQIVQYLLHIKIEVCISVRDRFQILLLILS